MKIKSYLSLLFFITSFLLDAKENKLPQIVFDNYHIKKQDTTVVFNKLFVAENGTLFIDAGASIKCEKIELKGKLVIIGNASTETKIECKNLTSDNLITATQCTFISSSIISKSNAKFELCTFIGTDIQNYGNTATLTNSNFNHSRVIARGNHTAVLNNKFDGCLGEFAIVCDAKESVLVQGNLFLNCKSVFEIEDYQQLNTTTIIDNEIIGDSNYLNSRYACFDIEQNIGYKTNLIIKGNRISNYNTIFKLDTEFSNSSLDEEEARISNTVTTKKIRSNLSITNNSIANCNTIVEIKCNGNIISKNNFIFEKNTINKFINSFKSIDTNTKNVKTEYFILEIGRNNFDGKTKKEIRETIYDFTTDYDQWIQFEL